MIAVIDVSATMQLLLKTQKADKFNEVLQKASLVLTPDLYVSELSNTLWKYHSFQKMSKELCVEHIENGIEIIDDFVSTKDIWRDAILAGIKNRHSVYDMMYMVAAREYGATLMTNDSELATVCRNVGVGVLI